MSKLISLTFFTLKKSQRVKLVLGANKACKVVKESLALQNIQFKSWQSKKLTSKPSGIPCPINRAFLPVCSKASVIVLTGVEPRILTTWLLKSTSTFLTPEKKCEDPNNVNQEIYGVLKTIRIVNRFNLMSANQLKINLFWSKVPLLRLEFT